jgi:hypothetical protein
MEDLLVLTDLFEVEECNEHAILRVAFWPFGARSSDGGPRSFLANDRSQKSLLDRSGIP